MRISDEEQIYTDFDWFCVDADGLVSHFASAGFKQLPPSVAESAEDLALVNGFFTELSSIADAHQLDTPESMKAELTAWNNGDGIGLKTWIACEGNSLLLSVTRPYSGLRSPCSKATFCQMDSLKTLFATLNVMETLENRSNGL